MEHLLLQAVPQDAGMPIWYLGGALVIGGIIGPFIKAFFDKKQGVTENDNSHWKRIVKEKDDEIARLRANGINADRLENDLRERLTSALTEGAEAKGKLSGILDELRRHDDPRD